MHHGWSCALCSAPDGQLVTMRATLCTKLTQCDLATSCLTTMIICRPGDERWYGNATGTGLRCYHRQTTWCVCSSKAKNSVRRKEELARGVLHTRNKIAGFMKEVLSCVASLHKYSLRRLTKCKIMQVCNQERKPSQISNVDIR